MTRESQDAPTRVDLAPAWAHEAAGRMYYVKSQIGAQPWLEGEHVLVSAGVAYRNPGAKFNNPPPENPASLFVDSGGFQAATHFGGEYPYSALELFEWAEEMGADYVAGMDVACETAEALAQTVDSVEESDIPSVPERIRASIEYQAEQARLYRARDWSFQFVPVVQGLEPTDYRYCARRLREEGVAAEYMGIGTVCKRLSVGGIRDVLSVVEDELPATKWHLFGATKSVWEDSELRSRFASADSHAWAMKTPDGEWTSTPDDKLRGFEAYKECIEAARAELIGQGTLSTDAGRSAFAVALVEGIGCRECLCGTEIPAYGSDFDPGCRHCEATHLNRWSRNMHAVETATHPEATHREDHSQSSLAVWKGDTDAPAKIEGAVREGGD